MKLKKICIVGFFILLVSFAFADGDGWEGWGVSPHDPIADAGPDQSAIFDEDITIAGTCTDPDEAGTDEGTLYDCYWTPVGPAWWLCDIGDAERTVIDANHNTASITVDCSWWQWWIDSRDLKFRLTAEDNAGNTDFDEMRLTVSRPEEEYRCDFSAFSQTIDFTEPIPDFSIPQWCGEGGTGLPCDLQSVLINSGATVEDFGFNLHNNESGQRNAAIKVEIRTSEWGLVEEHTNDVGWGTLSDNISLSFDSSRYDEEERYFIRVYYNPCSTIDASSISAAHYEYYTSPRNWTLVKEQEILIIPETVEFQCWDVFADYEEDFVEDSTFDSDLDSHIIAKGNRMRFYDFHQARVKCINGVPGSFTPMYEARVIDADTGETVSTYGNNPDGTLTLQNEFLVPFDEKGGYVVELYMKTCEEISEEGQHSWAAFYREYINEIPFPSDPITSYGVISLDSADMQADAAGDDTEFYFPPYEKTYTIYINWNFFNNSPDPYFGLSLVDVYFVESPPPEIGSAATTTTYPTIEAGEGAIIIEEFDVPLQTEEITKEVTVILTYDDKWGLDTIPEKTTSATIKMAFIPPPADVLLVEKIEILPSDRLVRDETESFDVRVSLRNFSKAIAEPVIGLEFRDQITNRLLAITVAEQTGIILPESRRTYTFTGMLLRDEPAFEAGKNYWVKAEVTNTGVEKVTINDEKKVPLTILALARPVAIPELPLILGLIIALIVLAIIRPKRE